MTSFKEKLFGEINHISTLKQNIYNDTQSFKKKEQFIQNDLEQRLQRINNELSNKIKLFTLPNADNSMKNNNKL